MEQDIGLFLTPEVRFGDLSAVYWAEAESLFDKIISTHNKDTDHLINGFISIQNSASMFPALFLYRHSIELLMKETMDLALEIEQRKKPPRSRYKHDLNTLHNDLLELCNKHCEDRVINDLSKAWLEIDYIHNADPGNGTNFRYLDKPLGKFCVLKLKADYATFKASVEETKRNLRAIIDHLNELKNT